MAQMVLNAIKPKLVELLMKAKASIPGALDALIAWLVGMLPTTVDKLTAGFKQVYGDIVTRLVAWLPSTKVPLTSAGDKLIELLKKVIGKL
jgi:hypothetical protein